MIGTLLWVGTLVWSDEWHNEWGDVIGCEDALVGERFIADAECGHDMKRIVETKDEQPGRGRIECDVLDDFLILQEPIDSSEDDVGRLGHISENYRLFERDNCDNLVFTAIRHVRADGELHIDTGE